MQVNVHEAKTRLSALLAAVERGEEVVIARGGVPVARLSAIEKPARRRFGGMLGQIRIAADFDDPLPEWEPYT